MIGISGSLIWSKPLMVLIFNPCGEFRWSPKGPASQIHSPHLHDGAPGIFSDLLWSVQMMKRQWCAESNGNYRTYSSQVKLQTRFLILLWKTCLWAELQPWYLSLQRTLGQNTQKIWKYPRGTNIQVRGMDLDNWALRTSPKFTTGVNISSIRVFDQIRDPEISITVRLLILSLRLWKRLYARTLLCSSGYFKINL